MNWQAAGELIAAYAALFGGIYAVVTRPLVSRLTGIVEVLARIQEKLEREARL